jgi:hypothetical protein
LERSVATLLAFRPLGATLLAFRPLSATLLAFRPFFHVSRGGEPA